MNTTKFIIGAILIVIMGILLGVGTVGIFLSPMLLAFWTGKMLWLLGFILSWILAALYFKVGTLILLFTMVIFDIVME